MKIGILHPGTMGISIAEQAVERGHVVIWCSEGRSKATCARAESLNLPDTGSLAETCAMSEVLISVCPPAFAEELAEAVLDAEFGGIFVEANAISPQRSEKIAAKFVAACKRYVDGGIVGPPAIGDRRNYLYLSGPDASIVASLFEGSQVTPIVLGEDYTKASAMKMCFASHSKGGWALTLNTLAAGSAYGVLDELLASWDRIGNGLTEQQKRQLSISAGKAWRFEGEMNEIADTFTGASLPGGIHLAAAELYHRLSKFKDTRDAKLEDILKSLLNRPD